MPHNFSHITLTTSNANNRYSIDIIEDPNVNDSSNGVIQYTPSGIPFYTLEITPNNYNNALYSLVISGNFKIDGISSSWSWNADLGNGQGTNGCYPPDPPYYASPTSNTANTIIKNSIAHSYVLNGTTCWPSPFIGNGTYRFQGPYIFDNSTYCDGDFLSSSDVVTWRKIILIDVYGVSSGMLANGDLSPAIEEDHNFWVTASVFNNQYGNVTNNGFPEFLRAFVFPEYHPTNPLTANMSINLDFDHFASTAGCTDPNATNYDPLAEISDNDMCSYAPAPLAFDPPTLTSDISSANHVVYTIVGLNGTVLNAPIDVLVLNNFDISIPTPTGGTPPYQDYEIQALFDNATTTGSPGGGQTLIPSPIMVIDDSASTINSTDPFTYDMCYTTTLPMQGTNIAGPGPYSFGKVFMEVPYDFATSPESYALQDITISIAVEDDNLGSIISAPLSVDIASQYN